jgi:hypothetical protein
VELQSPRRPARLSLSIEPLQSVRELVVLSTNNWSRIKAHTAEIRTAINAVTPGSYTKVAIPLE